MRLRSIVLAGAVLAIGVTTPAFANGPAAGKGANARSAMHMGTSVHRWRPRYDGRWYARWYVPGGWAAYRRPVAGYVLPHHYEHAVMTGRDGRVHDYRSDAAWQDQEDDVPPPGLRYDDEVTAQDGPPPPPHGYEGRWSGTWRGKDGKTYSGEYEGRFEGRADGSPGADFTPPPYATAPQAIGHHGAPGEPVVTTTQAPGFVAGGYYYPGATTTTVVIQTAATSTRTYVTQAPVRKRR